MINSRSTVGAMTPAKTDPVQAAANDEMNPLWLIAAGMAIFFAVAAVLVAAS
jgi:hypothetical protein